MTPKQLGIEDWFLLSPGLAGGSWGLTYNEPANREKGAVKAFALCQLLLATHFSREITKTRC